MGNLLFPIQFEEDTQLGKFFIFIRKKMTHKGENYSVKMQKYYFCNGTLIRSLLQRAFLLQTVIFIPSNTNPHLPIP